MRLAINIYKGQSSHFPNSALKIFVLGRSGFRILKGGEVSDIVIGKMDTDTKQLSLVA